MRWMMIGHFSSAADCTANSSSSSSSSSCRIGEDFHRAAACTALQASFFKKVLRMIFERIDFSVLFQFYVFFRSPKALENFHLPTTPLHFVPHFSSISRTFIEGLKFCFEVFFWFCCSRKVPVSARWNVDCPDNLQILIVKLSVSINYQKVGGGRVRCSLTV